MEEIYDLIIIGAGPAGLSAAIYAMRAKLRTLLIEKSFNSGGQVVNTYEVDNYPGLPKISGMELGETLKAHAQSLGIAFVRENVQEMQLEQDVKSIKTKKNTYYGKSVILAMGARHRMLGIPMEEELSGMGVSYCATCDGAFFKDKTVAVVGGGDVAVEDAILLARTCRQVYLIHRRDTLRATQVLQDALMELDNVEILWNHTVTEIMGQEQVEGILLSSTKSGISQSLEIDGLFIAVGILPNTGLVSGQVNLDDGGYIAAGEEGRTNLPGVYAAGDIRTKQLRQIITAASDGANCVTSVQKYLLTK